jgi:hypothetical protein
MLFMLYWGIWRRRAILIRYFGKERIQEKKERGLDWFSEHRNLSLQIGQL